MIAEDRLLTIAEALSSVAGVRAVVLGGSRARGTHHAESDVDLGIYYDAVTLDLHGLTEMTGAFNATGQVVVAGPGEWGPWVNGGGWLKIDDTDVDWILRDVDRVHEQCQRARRGQFEFHAVYRGHLVRSDYGEPLMTTGLQARGLVRFRNQMFKHYVELRSSVYSGVDQRVEEATTQW